MPPSLPGTTILVDSNQGSPSPEDLSEFLDESTRHNVDGSKVDPNIQVKEVNGKKEDKAVFCLRLVVILTLRQVPRGLSNAYKRSHIFLELGVW
ncbi:expressed unknown protein [Seminavis robusta]|uniref:Uncharacterized protein n=1 Tax=Seminavis robusta TaxID=568900 RepID=A0A9N8DX59_9STRA|nr:expressed unknown protein [Seminavis robusta]|eukprot:Sro360_g126350.1 n/a (94) ;mRNA; f:60904-61185